MRIVLTNDDGIDAPGIWALWQALGERGTIVAPQTHVSGCGHQVTCDRPIQVERRSEQAFAIAGTPADCTRLALTHLCPGADLVVSGINAGGNLGADVYISGTVAAAREAALHGVTGIAVSHYIRRRRPIDWEIAAQRTARVLDKLLGHPAEPGTYWNVNLPHLEAGAPEPEIVFCSLCVQPLPIAYEVQGDAFRYVGNYGDRARTPGADVEVCFSGNIAVTQIRL